MICTKCGKETSVLYKISEDSKNSYCEECTGSGGLVLIAVVVFFVVMAFLGSLAG